MRDLNREIGYANFAIVISQIHPLLRRRNVSLRAVGCPFKRAVGCRARDNRFGLYNQ